MRQIGRDLGVRYVLEGSVQRSGNRVRVSAQLVDAETDAHVWAEVAAACIFWLGAPKIRALVEATYFAGLRNTGASEE